MRAEKEETLSLFDIEELLGLPLVGVIPESSTVLTSTNLGQPIISMEDNAGYAYLDAVDRCGIDAIFCIIVFCTNSRHLLLTGIWALKFHYALLNLKRKDFSQECSVPSRSCRGVLLPLLHVGTHFSLLGVVRVSQAISNVLEL